MKTIKKLAGRLSSVFNGKSNVQRLGVLFIAGFAVIGVILLIRSFAATGQIYLLPSTTSVQNNTDVTVAVRINPGTSVGVVENVTVTYDSAKFQFVSINYTGSAFDASLAENTSTPGQVKFSRGALSNPEITTDSLIANVTLKALAGSGSTNLAVTGQAAGGNPPAYSDPAGHQVTMTLTGDVTTANSASYTIESTSPTPGMGSQFGLQVYVESDAFIQGGVVDVNLPDGLAYNGTLDTTGSAFNPATTVNGTTAQLVKLVFITQSTTLTGKHLVATIPVTASSEGPKAVNFSNFEVTDTNDQPVPTTANPFSITVGTQMPAPIVTIPGLPQLGASVDITDFRQSFSIVNFDPAATYTITIGGQTLAQSGGTFSLQTSLRNGDHTLVVSVSKSGASNSASHDVRLRSPNVNRLGCVDFADLSAVNKGYGGTNPEFDLDFNGTVGLIDLLTVTANWATTCVS